MSTPPTQGVFRRLFGAPKPSVPGPNNEPSSYPPAQDAYIGVQPEKLLRAHADKFGAIHADFAQFYPQWPQLRNGIDRLLLNVAAHVQQLPASRNHHHAEQGGLFAHILEVALIALNRRQEYNPRFGLYGSDTFLAEVAWPLSVLIGAMLHDIAKPAYMMRVFAEPRMPGIDRRQAWNPYTESLFRFMSSRNVDRVFVDWLEDRGNGEHDMFAAIWLLRIVPEELMHLLHSAPVRFLFWLQRFLTDRPEPLGKKNILAEVITWADHRSAREDVTGHNISYRWGLSQSVSQVFRTFAAQSQWNADKAMFWLGKMDSDPNTLSPLWILSPDNCQAFKKYAEPFFPASVGLGYDKAEIAQHLVAGGVAWNAKGVDLENDKLALPSAKCRIVFGKLDHVFPHVLFLEPAQVFTDTREIQLATFGLVAGDLPPDRSPPTITAAVVHRPDAREISLPGGSAASGSIQPAAAAPPHGQQPDTALGGPGLTVVATVTVPAGATGEASSVVVSPAALAPAASTAAGASPPPSSADATSQTGSGSSAPPEAHSAAEGASDQPTTIPTLSSVQSVSADTEPLAESSGAQTGAEDPSPRLIIEIDDDDDEAEDDASTSAPAAAVTAPQLVDPGDPFAAIGATPAGPSSSATSPTRADRRPVTAPDLLRKWRFLSLWSDEHDPDALTHLVIAYLLEIAYRQEGGGVPERLWGGVWRANFETEPDFPVKRMVPLKVISDGHNGFMSVMAKLDPVYFGFAEEAWPTPDPRALISAQKTPEGAFLHGPNGFPKAREPSVNLSPAGLRSIKDFLPQLHAFHAERASRTFFGVADQ